MTTSVGAKRRRVDDLHMFDAPGNLTQDLQKILVDLIELPPACSYRAHRAASPPRSPAVKI
jgi:hypothetical protein